MRFETRDAAYFKNILKLIKQITLAPRLTINGNTITIKEYDIPKFVYIEVVLQNPTNNFRSMFGGRAAATSTEEFEVTADIEELINTVSAEISQITITADAVTAGNKPIKTYPTFKSDLPTLQLHPTYSSEVNLTQTLTSIKEMEYITTLESNNTEIVVTHDNGDDTIKTEKIKPINIIIQAPTKSSYSATILNNIIKILNQLADTAKISYANDEPIKIEVALRLGMGKLCVCIAPIIITEEKA